MNDITGARPRASGPVGRRATAIAVLLVGATLASAACRSGSGVEDGAPASTTASTEAATTTESTEATTTTAAPDATAAAAPASTAAPTTRPRPASTAPP